MIDYEEKYSLLRAQVIWATTHYGAVNTDGIIEQLKRTILFQDTGSWDGIRETGCDVDQNQTGVISKFPTMNDVKDSDTDISPIKDFINNTISNRNLQEDVDYLIEECGELLQALIKFRRNKINEIPKEISEILTGLNKFKKDSISNLAEEIGDVMLMCSIVSSHLGYNVDVVESIKNKIERIKNIRSSTLNKFK